MSVSASDITSAPPSPVEGQTATLQATVRNLGDGAAGPFTVSFYAGDPARNGFLIDTVLVGALDARSETLVPVEWDPVNARGDVLVFVDVDSGESVEEIDELDNRVFRVVDVQGLPELIATTAQLQLSPPFARSGESVSIQASFTNAGEQEAGPMAVEIRLDDLASGALVASEEGPRAGFDRPEIPRACRSVLASLRAMGRRPTRRLQGRLARGGQKKGFKAALEVETVTEIEALLGTGVVDWDFEPHASPCGAQPSRWP